MMRWLHGPMQAILVVLNAISNWMVISCFILTSSSFELNKLNYHNNYLRWFTLQRVVVRSRKIWSINQRSREEILEFHMIIEYPKLKMENSIMAHQQCVSIMCQNFRHTDGRIKQLGFIRIQDLDLKRFEQIWLRFKIYFNLNVSRFD